MTLATAALLTLPPTSEVFAQNTASPGSAASAPANATTQAAGSYVAVVTGNAVNVRCGPSAQGAYVFGKLRSGDTVQVLAEEFGWAKVRTNGPAFRGMTAYVPADRRFPVTGEAASVTGGANTSVQVAARTELRAPNVDASGSPDKSWKQIGIAEPGTMLVVQGVVQGEKESVYKVDLPATCEGWINMQFLRRANDGEVAMHTAAMAAPAPAAPVAVPVMATAQPVNAAPAGAPAVASVQRDQPKPVATAQDPTMSSPSIPPLLGNAAARTSTTVVPGATGAVAANVRTDSHGEGSIGSDSAPRARVVVESGRATWTDLESQWNAVRQQPQATAELDALRGRYVSLANTSPAKSALAQMASTRAEQLSLLQEAQKQSQELTGLKSKLSERQLAMIQMITDIQRRADYCAIGILNASVVYDGKSLPQLYRVTDPQTSQTIAYVLPNESIPMGTMLGTLVGVKGGKDFDSALNINVISPQVVELLTVRDKPQVTRVETKTETAAPATGLAEKVVAPVVVPAPAPATTEEDDCWDELPPLFEPETPPSTTP